MSYEICSDLLVQLKSLSEAIAIKSLQMADWPPDLKEEIHRFAFVANVGASTRIENAILTDAEADFS